MSEIQQHAHADTLSYQEVIRTSSFHHSGEEVSRCQQADREIETEGKSNRENVKLSALFLAI